MTDDWRKASSNHFKNDCRPTFFTRHRDFLLSRDTLLTCLLPHLGLCIIYPFSLDIGLSVRFYGRY